MELLELQRLAEEDRLRRKPVRILCCTASGCRASNSLGVLAALEKAITEKNLADQIEAVGVGCPGLCSRGPLVEYGPDQGTFEKVQPEQAASIVERYQGGTPQPRALDLKQPFFTRQKKVVRALAGRINPERIEEYLAEGGYEALDRALQMAPTEVVQEVTRSGLRGRGGAGYPTGLKWATVAKMPASSTRYVICNGDEGDPGAFMDRSVMEDLPHLLLEGMAIAAHAVGARQGYIYVRAEYPLAVERLRRAINQATKWGLLGGGILGSPFDFKVEIRIGAGAFVCGEETALIASVEGKRGTPRPRPPYPAESGLWNQPTLINNVETLATIPAILRQGAAWFASIGTEKSKGTKIFSLTGKVANSGLIEVPMGLTLREVVESMGGGVPGGTIKAVQTGGPSGGCIPAQFLDTPIDYESLAALGSIMGSGGMIVMDENDRMPEVARFFMEFCADESCGKCVPCRVGTVQLHRLLTRLIERQGTAADLEKLVQLCYLVRDTSLCGLGQSAPNPLLTTLKYFGHEYEQLLQPEEFPRPSRPTILPLKVI